MTDWLTGGSIWCNPSDQPGSVALESHHGETLHQHPFSWPPSVHRCSPTTGSSRCGLGCEGVPPGSCRDPRAWAWTWTGTSWWRTTTIDGSASSPRTASSRWRLSDRHKAFVNVHTLVWPDCPRFPFPFRSVPVSVFSVLSPATAVPGNVPGFHCDWKIRNWNKDTSTINYHIGETA